MPVRSQTMELVMGLLIFIMSARQKESSRSLGVNATKHLAADSISHQEMKNGIII